MKFFSKPRPLSEKRFYHFLAPRFWGTWLALGLLRLLSYLPYWAMIKVGSGLGHLARLLLKKQRHVTEVNLRLCFPELSDLERKTLLKKNFASLGVGILEMSLAWWASNRRLQKMVVFQNIENLHAAQKKGKGILCLTYHFTSIELGIRLFSLFTPANVIYRPQKNLLFEWFLEKARRRYCRQLIMRNDMRSILRSLSQGNLVISAVDQNFSSKKAVFAPFFGVLANSITGTGRLANKTESVLLPTFYFRDPQLKKYVIYCEPVLENIPDDELAHVTLINQIIENAIRKHPEQYFWQQKRFETRPAGEASFY